MVSCLKLLYFSILGSHILVKNSLKKDIPITHKKIY